jgi:hypothetical protein
MIRFATSLCLEGHTASSGNGKVSNCMPHTAVYRPTRTEAVGAEIFIYTHTNGVCFAAGHQMSLADWVMRSRDSRCAEASTVSRHCSYRSVQ